LRPSLGLVPRSGSKDMCPDKHALHSVNGPMARNVRDLALLLDAIRGTEGWRSDIVDDLRSSLMPPPSYARLLDENHQNPRDITRLKVAWTPDAGLDVPIDSEVSKLVEDAQRWFAKAGATVEGVDVNLIEAPKAFLVKRGGLYYKEFMQKPKSLRDGCKPEIHWNVGAGEYILENEHLFEEAEEKVHAINQQMDALFQQFDVLLMPCTILPPFDAEIRYVSKHRNVELQTYIDWFCLTSAISVTRCPALSLPCGFNQDGLPIGLQIVGRPGCDDEVLQAALAYEDGHSWASKVPLDPQSPTTTDCDINVVDGPRCAASASADCASSGAFDAVFGSWKTCPQYSSRRD